VKLFGVCTTVCDLFHLTQYSSVPFMLLQITEFLNLNNILLYIMLHFLYSSSDGHLD
jgi:hypothetical protein